VIGLQGACAGFRTVQGEGGGVPHRKEDGSQGMPRDPSRHGEERRDRLSIRLHLPFEVGYEASSGG
jgi:hypothetical protein